MLSTYDMAQARMADFHREAETTRHTTPGSRRGRLRLRFPHPRRGGFGRPAHAR